MHDASRAGRIRSTIGYYLAFICLGIALASLGATLPQLARQTGAAIGEVGLLFTANFFGYLVGSYLSGVFYDRFAGHPILSGALFLTAVCLALIPLTPVFAVLVAILFMLGIASGLMDVGANTLLVWTHRGEVGPYMSGLHFFFGFGAILSPLVVDGIIGLAGSLQGAESALGEVFRTASDISWAFWALALLVLPAAAWLLPVKSPEPYARPIATNGGRTAGLGALIVLMSALYFTFHGSQFGFGGWVNTVAVSGLGEAESVGRQLTSVYWASLAFGRLLTIPLLRWSRPQFVFVGNLMGCFVGLTAVALWGDGLNGLWVGTLIFGMCIGPLSPTAISMAERIMPITGRTTGWFLIGSNVGNMLVPWVIGLLFESFGRHAMTGVLFVTVTACATVFTVLMLATRHQRAAEAA